MHEFWAFARYMLRYRRLLTVAAVTVVFDAVSALGGFSFLVWVIDHFLGGKSNLQDQVRAKLSDPAVQAIIGDVTHLADRLPAEPFNGFLLLLGVIAVLACIGTTFRIAYQFAAITISFRAVMDVRRDAFQHLLHVPMSVLAQQSISDSLSRVVRDSGALGRGFSALTSRAVRGVLMGLVALLVALWSNWALTGLFVLGMVPIGILIRKFGKHIRRATRHALRGHGHMLGAVSGAVQALAVVKVHQAEGYERRRFNTMNRRVLQAELKARTVRALSSPVVEVISILGVVFIAAVAGWMIYRGGSEPTDLVKVLLLLGAAGASLRPVANLNNELNEAAAAARRIRETLELPTEPSRRTALAQALPPLPRHQSEIRFERVSFTYPGGSRPAVRDVELEVAHGQCLALVGGNGAGKTTLLHMLPRLIDPEAGRITIDGHDIATVSLRSLRSQIAMVTQQAVLFEGTIADNIAYGRRHERREAIVEAARAAYAHDFIDALPEGYDTPLRELGEGLSGGQRQRICIARAILRDPAILILDEATSQIDADSEAKINRALQSFRTGRTVLIIAHRLSTVVDADRIVVMDDGQLADQGRHHELLERCPTYQALVQHQLLPAHP